METSLENFISIFGICCPSVIALVSVCLALWYNYRTIQDRKVADEKKEIFRKLNSFYGPFQHLMQQSRLLNERFKKSKPENYHALTAILEGQEIKGNNQVLIKEIMKITAEMDDLIIQNSGLVDDEALRLVLAKASTHFKILKLAYEGLLKGDQDTFSDFIYPKELDGMIIEEISRLKNRLEKI